MSTIVDAAAGALSVRRMRMLESVNKHRQRRHERQLETSKASQRAAEKELEEAELEVQRAQAAERERRDQLDRLTEPGTVFDIEGLFRSQFVVDAARRKTEAASKQRQGRIAQLDERRSEVRAAASTLSKHLRKSEHVSQRRRDLVDAIDQCLLDQADEEAEEFQRQPLAAAGRAPD